MTARLLVVPALLAAVAVGGCGAEAGDPGVADSDDRLAGQTFVATGVTVDGEPDPLVDGTTVQIGFTDGGVSADAGCNHMSGQARYAGGRLTVDVVGGTEMGCAPARMRQDAWLADFLTGDPRYRLDGDVLTLTSGLTVISLGPVGDTDTGLTGTTWVLEGIVDGAGPDASVGSIPGRVLATLRLRGDDLLLVRTGCNTGSATVSVEAGSMHLSDLLLTQVACAGARGAVERDVLRVLHDGEIELDLDGDTLRLTAGAHGLLYRALVATPLA